MLSRKLFFIEKIKQKNKFYFKFIKKHAFWRLILTENCKYFVATLRKKADLGRKMCYFYRPIQKTT